MLLYFQCGKELRVKKNLSSWDKKCPLSLVRIQLICSAATLLGFLLAGVLT